MFSKKGVSPLIATILLLAFAVSLAVVVMNILPAGVKVLKKVEIPHVDGIPRACYNQEAQQVEVFVSNGEKRTIEGFGATISGTIKPKNIQHISVHIGSNEEAKVNIPYEDSMYGQIVSIKLFPKVNVSNSLVEHTMSKNLGPVPSCAG